MNTQEHNAGPINSQRRRRDDHEPSRPWARKIALVAAAILVLAAIVAGIKLASASELPASVLVTERDYTAGTVSHACWLDSASYVAVGTGYALLVDCHSDIDGLFKNGFETTT